MNDRDRPRRDGGGQRDGRGGPGRTGGGRGRRPDGPRRERPGGERTGDRGGRQPGPPIPDDVSASDLDNEVRRDLLTLDKANAEIVARHLVMVSRFLLEDPTLALEHARAARSRASRVGVVRETVGIAAYNAGEWQESATELRAARRITGNPALLPLIADCERGLGRPERAVEIARGEEGRALKGDEATEMRIVEAGARMDMGEPEKALVTLQLENLKPGQVGTGPARLFYAYASALEAAGRRNDAVTWFMNAAAADVDDVTDAELRLTELAHDDEAGDGPDSEPIESQRVESQSDAAGPDAAEPDTTAESIESVPGTADLSATSPAGSMTPARVGTDAPAESEDVPAAQPDEVVVEGVPNPIAALEDAADLEQTVAESSASELSASELSASELSASELSASELSASELSASELSATESLAPVSAAPASTEPAQTTGPAQTTETVEADEASQTPSRAEVSSPTLLDRYDALLLDLDGTVFAGHRALPNAVDTLARTSTPRYFVTNNASRRPREVAEHLRDLGFDATDDLVVTSAQSGARLLAEHLEPGSRALVVGTDGLAQEVREVGIGVTRSADDRPAAVIQGHSPDTGWAQLSEAALAIRAGALWVATNVDATLPSERGLLVGNGSMVAALINATGKEPLVAGKPAAPLMVDAIRRASANSPLVVGDRLDTDIEGAHAVGVESALVLTGVSTVVDLLVAPPEQRPTYVIDDLAGLFAVADEVRATDQPGWVITVDSSTVTVAGSGTDASLVPALAAATWAAVDAGSVDAADLRVVADGAARSKLAALGVGLVD